MKVFCVFSTFTDNWGQHFDDRFEAVYTSKNGAFLAGEAIKKRIKAQCSNGVYVHIKEIDTSTQNYNYTAI